MLLFGGQSEYRPPYTEVGETWWYDPADDEWTQVTTDPQPRPRSAAHLAVHTPTGTVVMFGGAYPAIGGFETLSETWTFDPVQEQWSQLAFSPGASPQAVIGEMFGYHLAADLFVLHGGFTFDGFQYVDHTWHLDLDDETWTEVEPTTSPPGRNYNSFAYDPRNELMVMSGGREDQIDELWTYDPRDLDWKKQTKLPDAPSVGYTRMVFDSDLGTLIRFGGLGEEAGLVWTVSEDFEWSRMSVEGESPEALSRHALNFVPGYGVLVFGGVYRGEIDFHNDTWLLDTVERRWERR